MNENFPQPEPRRQNVPLGRADSHMGGGVMLVMALLWNGLSWGVGGVMYFGAHDVPWFAFLIIGVFIVLGAVLMIGAVMRLMAQAKLAPPQVVVSVQPLYLGEELTGRFEQVAKSHASVNRVAIKLVCREEATYRSGTDRRTVTHDVLSEEIELPGLDNADAMSGLHGEFRFRIPVEAMHSFRANRNKINWLIETHTDVADWPDYKSVFELEVAPKRVAPPRR